MLSRDVADDAELELGLGLSIGGRTKHGSSREYGRILTAQDFPSLVSKAIINSNNVASVSGTKRAAAEPASQEGGGDDSPTSASQIVGWPPIRSYRMNSLSNQAKAPHSMEGKRTVSKKDELNHTPEGNRLYDRKTSGAVKEAQNLGFVKVSVDGIPIGRKVDLNAHTSYETLAHALVNMFFRSMNPIGDGEKELVNRPSKLLDGLSAFVLTYEDKEGDWMLVGDVPWGMFLSSVKRLRIMRTSEAGGLAMRSQEINWNQMERRNPI
ncbi:hypothetical protein SAY86_011345 [Trapa natans]|uniref:Auxin-responsive protein n=1 Tax=Trapa natans TaxID=22666 RepID=A0AAN7LIT8_TRANT|nr:hypothetical protein SAY86_011345 [Trapa natans]